MELRSNRATQVPLPDFCFRCWDKPNHTNGPFWLFAWETLQNWTLKTWWSMTTLIGQQTFTNSSFTGFLFLSCHCFIRPNWSSFLSQLLARPPTDRFPTGCQYKILCTQRSYGNWWESLVWNSGVRYLLSSQSCWKLSSCTAFLHDYC